MFRKDDITSLRKDPGIVLAVFLKIHLNLRSWFCCISFLNLTGAQLSVGYILFLLTNLYVALTYSVTMYEQTTKDCAPSGSCMKINLVSRPS